MSVAEREHVWSAVSGDLVDGRATWVGNCSCGWSGEPRYSIDEALRDAEGHVTASLGWEGKA